MITEYLKTLKNKQNMTTAQISAKSGISEATIYRIFKGEGKSVDFDTILSVVRALGGSIDEACGLTDESHPLTDESRTFTDESHPLTDESRLSAMIDDIHALYAEEIRHDIVDTYNQRVADEKAHFEQRLADANRYYEQRLADEKEHYAKLIAEKNEIHHQRVDNLTEINASRAKIINRLLLVIGSLSLLLIVLVAVMLFFPTNAILRL